MDEAQTPRRKRNWLIGATLFIGVCGMLLLLDPLIPANPALTLATMGVSALFFAYRMYGENEWFLATISVVVGLFLIIFAINILFRLA